jgi:hypothetical protein
MLMIDSDGKMCLKEASSRGEFLDPDKLLAAVREINRS